MPVVSFDYIKQHEKMREEINRLRVENIQMQAALGYAICAEDERHIIPSNPYKCGVCDANRGIHDEIERLRAALRRVSELLCSDCHMNAFRAALEGK